MTDSIKEIASSDRELLEMAAKAAGYEFVRHSECGDGVLLAGVQDAWRPLVDDGDALRLAVKLRMQVICTGAGAIVRVQGVYRGECFDGNDVLGATRRAIVRAAAALADQAGRKG